MIRSSRHRAILPRVHVEQQLGRYAFLRSQDCPLVRGKQLRIAYQNFLGNLRKQGHLTLERSVQEYQRILCRRLSLCPCRYLGLDRSRYPFLCHLDCLDAVEMESA